MNRVSQVVAAGVLACSVVPTWAQADMLQLRSWASACANCHGTNGVAQPGMETLAGASKEGMTQKLLDFKSGRRPATIMHQLAKGYTDEQLEQIAGYFAAQKK